MNYKTNRTNKTVILSQYTFLSIITLNVSGLNCPIKGHRVAEWIKISNYVLATRVSFRFMDTYKLKIKGWKKTFYEYKSKQR